MSLERFTTLFTLVPEATATSYIVTVGPRWAATTRASTPNVESVCAEGLHDVLLVLAVVRGRRRGPQAGRVTEAGTARRRWGRCGRAASSPRASEPPASGSSSGGRSSAPRGSDSGSTTTGSVSPRRSVSLGLAGRPRRLRLLGLRGRTLVLRALLLELRLGLRLVLDALGLARSAIAPSRRRSSGRARRTTCRS